MLIVLSIAALIASLTILDHLMSNNWSGVTSKNRNETVFAQRKKDYGAYQLRVDYSKRLLAILLFLGIGIGGMSVASLKMFRVKEKVEKTKEPFRNFPPDVKPEVLPEVKPETDKGGAPPVNPTVFITPKIDETEIPDEIEPIEKNGEIVDKKIEGEGDNPFNTGKKGDGEETDLIEKIKEKEDEGPIDVVDEPAQYKGGFAAMRQFIVDHIRVTNVEGSGKVYVKFVVEKDGHISKVVKFKDATDCFGCVEAAIEVVKSMPDWEPAKLNGKPVRAWFTLPIVIADGM